MQSKLFKISAVFLCFVIIFAFSSCGASDKDDNSEEFQAATLSVPENAPVSESEIIDFYNNLVSDLQKNENFTSENRPGVTASETISTGDIQILSYNSETGTAQESEQLSALNGSAAEIKNRIIRGIDTSIPVIPFGDMNTSISSVIYPYDSDEITIEPENVKSAECNIDGSNLNIYIILNNTPEAVANVFGIRDKNTLLNDINSYSEKYAKINDYTVSYVEDEESDTHCSIYMTVEVEKADSGKYICTGRVMSLDYKIISDVSVNASCVGVFSEYGDIQINFRMTDEKYYQFDWLGTAAWEPLASE